MPLGDDHYEPVVIKEEATEKNKTETSTVAGGKAPSKPADAFFKKAGQIVQEYVLPVVDPRHYKDNGEIDWAATGVHGAADAAALIASGIGLKRAISPNPLPAQTQATLKKANIEAETAAAKRAHELEVLSRKQAHELEMAKLKAAGVVQTAPTTATPVTTTPTVTSPTSTPTPTLAQINVASAAPAATSAATTVVSPPDGTTITPYTPPANPLLENPTVPLDTEVGNPPKGSDIVKKAAENPEKNAVAEGRKKVAIVQDFMRDAKGNIVDAKGNVMSPAAKAGMEAFNAQYPDQAKAFAAKGQFGILGAGSSMNSLHNTWGTDVAKQLRNELVSGNLLGGAQEYPEIRSKIAAIPPESATGKQLADIREKNPKGGIYGSLGKSVTMKEGKLIEGKNLVPDIVKKGIGPAVLLMSIADAAKAKSAREGAGVLAEGVFNALAPMGISPSELASGTLTEKQLNAYKEAQKLGSPYRSVPPPR